MEEVEDSLLFYEENIDQVGKEDRKPVVEEGGVCIWRYYRLWVSNKKKKI